MSTPTSHAVTLKLFLVDDNDDTRHLLTQLLQASGYEVRTAATKTDALRDFPPFGADVLLTDIGLPDGDGWELLRELTDAGLSPYAIAMSGFGALSDLAASKRAGFRHHLVKPIELGALERVLQEACEEITAPH
jgi:CheY-like chemotaxis protein